MSDPRHALRRLVQDAALRDLRTENAALAKRLEDAERTRDTAMTDRHDELQDLRAENEALQAEVAALRKDEKRLELIASHPRDSEKILANYGKDSHRWRTHAVEGMPFREYFDAAIAAENP